MLGSRKARELPVQCKIYSDNMTTRTLFKQWYFKSDKSTFTELQNTIYMLKFTSQITLQVCSLRLKCSLQGFQLILRKNISDFMQFLIWFRTSIFKMSPFRQWIFSFNLSECQLYQQLPKTTLPSFLCVENQQFKHRRIST